MAASSYLPPRIGSVPWFAKSRPYKLSPSRIFCLHWVPGASWRTQSRTQGRGELGPGLKKNHAEMTLTTFCESCCFHLFFKSCHHWKLAQWVYKHLWCSPGTTGVVVRHEAESIDYRGQLLKLLPAEHAWLARTDPDREVQKMKDSLAQISLILCCICSGSNCTISIHLVTAGGMTRMQSNLLAFRVSHMCCTKCTSSLKEKVMHSHFWLWTLRLRQTSDDQSDRCVDRITHFLLLPPSWLHISNVKPSKPSVCTGTASLDKHCTLLQQC